jgi:copper chaperone NosL
MRELLILICMLVSWSCTVKPELIQYGKDACHFCKMKIVDQRFGGELVTNKGKIFKFDDVNCLIRYYHSQANPSQEFTYILVTDFNHPGTLIDAKSAFYLKSDRIRTPMASEMAAFVDEGTMLKFKSDWGAMGLTWQELLTLYP